ncbi:MAG TPA: hypothetical protein VJ698_16225 [Noviherbaspirillum sp.]|uniref:hypothetical protein n=1 Tax=Noviherbaspirillum sp. TaxID=1926288 RepID=UPI002B4A4FD0|nr:hypothetical protein [Noviherbaspirillum sp.]HJV87014.1 hypothetical protein [Noviherbaspirillum sp.]
MHLPPAEIAGGSSSFFKREHLLPFFLGVSPDRATEGVSPAAAGVIASLPIFFAQPDFWIVMLIRQQGFIAIVLPARINPSCFMLRGLTHVSPPATWYLIFDSAVSSARFRISFLA